MGRVNEASELRAATTNDRKSGPKNVTNISFSYMHVILCHQYRTNNSHTYKIHYNIISCYTNYIWHFKHIQYVMNKEDLRLIRYCRSLISKGRHTEKNRTDKEWTIRYQYVAYAAVLIEAVNMPFKT